ncbi:MAG: ATP-grasp domain-containing protein [Proteobacteria bacterium]|nr:ATP-grasp domain-containing protein [Pseudomonadota bacterium]
MKVLLCGARSPVAMDLARAFKFHEIEFRAADTFKPLVFDGLCEKFHIYDAPALNYEKFCADILAINSEFKPDIIIAMNEEVFHFAKLAKSHNIPLFAPDLSILMMLHSKLRFIEFAKSIGLNVPKTWIMRGDESPNELVFKNEFSRFGENVFIRPKSLPKQNSQNPIIAQEYIKGIDISFYAIAKNGAICAFSSYSSDWRTKGGASFYFAPCDEKTNAKALAIAAKIVQKSNYTGQISCDLRIANDGNLYLIECNPRASSGLHLLIDDDFEIIKAIIENKKITIKSSAKYIGLAMMFLGIPLAIKRGKIKKLLEDIQNAKNVYEKRNILALLDMIRHSLHAIIKQQSLSQFLTHDIECNFDLETN